MPTGFRSGWETIADATKAKRVDVNSLRCVEKQNRSVTTRNAVTTNGTAAVAKPFPVGLTRIPVEVNGIAFGVKSMPSRTDWIPAGAKSNRDASLKIPDAVNCIACAATWIAFVASSMAAATNVIADATKLNPLNPQQVACATPKIHSLAKWSCGEHEKTSEAGGEILLIHHQRSHSSALISVVATRICFGPSGVACEPNRVSGYLDRMHFMPNQTWSGSTEISFAAAQICFVTNQIWDDAWQPLAPIEFAWRGVIPPFGIAIS